MPTQHKCTPTCLPTPTHSRSLGNVWWSLCVKPKWICLGFPAINLNLSLSTHGQIKGRPSCVCVPITGQHDFDVKVAHCVLYVRIFKEQRFLFLLIWFVYIWGDILSLICHSVLNKRPDWVFVCLLCLFSGCILFISVIIAENSVRMSDFESHITG